MFTFKDATIAGFKNTLKFGGVATRSEYWWFFLASFLIGFVAALVSEIHIALAVMVFPLQLWMGIAGFSLAFRRVRDAGGSVWWIIGSMIAALIAFALLTISIAANLSEVPAIIAMIFVLIYIGCALTSFIYTLLPTKDRHSENP